MPLIPPLVRWISDSRPAWSTKVSSRTVGATQRKRISKNKTFIIICMNILPAYKYVPKETRRRNWNHRWL